MDSCSCVTLLLFCSVCFLLYILHKQYNEMFTDTATTIVPETKADGTSTDTSSEYDEYDDNSEYDENTEYDENAEYDENTEYDENAEYDENGEYDDSSDYEETEIPATASVIQASATPSTIAVSQAPATPIDQNLSRQYSVINHVALAQ